MLARQQRLRRSSDIQSVYQTGRKSFHPLVRLITARSFGKTTRATVVVSLKISKKAVERNRIKRRLRALWRQSKVAPTIPLDCVIIAQPKAKRASYQALQQALAQVLAQQHLL